MKGWGGLVLQSLAAMLFFGAAELGALSPTPECGKDAVLHWEPYNGPALPSGVRYCGGGTLVSSCPAFGGFSDVRYDPERERIFLLSDKGYLWTATAGFSDDGFLRDIHPEGVHGLMAAKPSLRPLMRRLDAEGLALWPDGALAITLERIHRVLLASPLGEGTADLLVQQGEYVPAITGLKQKNRGVEALTAVGEDELWMVSEHIPLSQVPALSGKGYPKNSTVGWHMRRGQSASEWQPFVMWRDPGSRFKPTGASWLDGSRILLTERAFSPIHGFDSLLSLVPDYKAELIKPKTKIQLEGVMMGENLEGIHAWRSAEGEVKLMLVADDNFYPWQRTRLVVLCVEPGIF
jgi:hypothetical protein